MISSLKRIASFLFIAIFMLSLPSAICESYQWECPECHASANTGNFCGFCGHPAPPIPDPTPFVLSGDVTGDGIVDLVDLIEILKYLSGKDLDINLEACDVNGDDFVDLLDVIELHKLIIMGGN